MVAAFFAAWSISSAVMSGMKLVRRPPLAFSMREMAVALAASGRSTMPMPSSGP